MTYLDYPAGLHRAYLAIALVWVFFWLSLIIDFPSFYGFDRDLLANPVMLLLLIVPPIALYCLGELVAWIVRGFHASPPKPPHHHQ